MLFHVTADTTWSNLPMSGLFVDMLRRIVARAGAGAGGNQRRGRWRQARRPARPTASSTASALSARRRPTPRRSATDFPGPGDAAHPPGFYGAGGGAGGGQCARLRARRSTPADFAGLAVAPGGLDVAAPLDLSPWLLLAALIGFLVDGLASLWLGRAPRFARPAAAALLVFGALAGAALDAPPARAGDAPISARDAEAARGDPSRLCRHRRRGGRRGLASRPRERSGACSASAPRREVAAPIALDPARDELSFYPLIYWPIVADRPQPPAQRGGAHRRLHEVRRHGGVRHPRRAEARPGGAPTPESANGCATLLAGVDVPELEPVPRDHVVTKTFYLIDRFVGRTEAA